MFGKKKARQEKGEIDNLSPPLNGLNTTYMHYTIGVQPVCTTQWTEHDLHALHDRRTTCLHHSTDIKENVRYTAIEKTDTQTACITR